MAGEIPVRDNLFRRNLIAITTCQKFQNLFAQLINRNSMVLTLWICKASFQLAGPAMFNNVRIVQFSYPKNFKMFEFNLFF